MSDSASSGPEGVGGEAPFEVISAHKPYAFAGAWYDYATASHFWFEWRLAAMLRQIERIGLPRREALRVLEIGCGTGVLRSQVERETSWIIDGTDLDHHALSRSLPARGRTLYYDILEQRPEFVGAYDVVILYDVLEHIEDTRPFLEAALRHLRPGGHILVNVPALPALYSAYDEIVDHVRRYTKRTLAAEFDGLGVATRDVSYWAMSMVPLVGLRKLVLARMPQRSVDDRIKLGFNPPGALAHRILGLVMRAETRLLERPPVGTSVLFAGQRQ